MDSVAELFSGYQAVTPQFKVVQTDKKGRPRTENAEERLQGAQAEKTGKPSVYTRGRRKKEADPREMRTVFVGNLPAAVTRRKLRQLFSQHGKVASVRLRSLVVEKGRLPVRVAKRKQKQVSSSTVNAYIVFEEEEQAVKALSLNGALFSDRHIRVDLAGRARDHTHRRSVFVGGLPYSTDDEELREVFTKFGEVESVRVVREPRTGLGKGFGFVTFAEESGVMFSLQHSRHITLGGHQLRVMRSRNITQVRERETTAKFSGLQARKTAKQGRKGGRDARTGGGRDSSMRNKSGTAKDQISVADKSSVGTAGSGNPLRPSRTFHKKKEARRREREKQKLLGRTSLRKRPLKHTFKKAHSKQ